MPKYVFWDPSKWYRYSPPRDENFYLNQPEKGKRSKKRRRASAAVRRRSRAGSMAGSRAGSLAPSIGDSTVEPQSPQPRQRHDAVSGHGQVFPLQSTEADNQYQQPYPALRQATEVGYQHGPALPFPPVICPFADQDPRAILPTGRVHPYPSQIGYADPTMAATGRPWPWPMIQDGRRFAGGRQAEVERDVTGPCLLCTALLLAVVISGLLAMLFINYLIAVMPMTEETTTLEVDDMTRENVFVYAQPSTTRRTTQPPASWLQTANTGDPRYMDRYHRTACVFHASADGLEAVSTGGRTRFGLSLFPFALCRVALFCCPSLEANVEPGSEQLVQMMVEFASWARRTGFVEPLMMLGDGSQSSHAPFEQLLNHLEAGKLPDSARLWYKMRNYMGVVLRFPDVVRADTWLRVPRLLGQLAQELAASPGLNVRLGAALRQDTHGADLRGLAGVLGQVSIFLLPPVIPLGRYTGNTFSYYSESTLASLSQLYSTHFMPDQAQSVCYLLPADTYTFQTVSPTNQTPVAVERSLRAGIQGPVTMQPGRMAYFESCRVVADRSYVTAELKYSMVASRGDSWLSYTKPQLLGSFADALHVNASATCIGLWNPQWDDFASICGLGAYPYSRALFRRYADVHP